MKFSCEKSDLSDVVSIAGRTQLGYGGVPSVRLSLEGSRLQVTGKDPDLLIEVETTVAGADDGTVLLPAVLTTHLVNSLPAGSLEFSIDDNSATLTAGRVQFIVESLLDLTPPFLKGTSGETVTVDEAKFREALSQVVKAAARDDGRDVIYTGVLFASVEGGLRLVSTDGLRLAMRDIAGVNLLGGERQVIVPARALGELEKILGSLSNGSGQLSVGIGQNEAVFRIGGVTLTTRLIEGSYRDYRQIVETAMSRKLIVDKDVFLDSAKRLRILAKETREVTYIRMDIEDDSVTLSVRKPQVGEGVEVLGGDFVGEPLAIAFDPDLLISGLEGVACDRVTMEFTETNKAAKISNTDDDSYTYVLMPIRI